MGAVVVSHTPGPWYAEKSSEDFWYVTMDEDAFGRAVGQTWNAGKGKDCQEANARVMAAGPEMLAAIKLAEDVLSRFPFSGEMWPGGHHPNTGIEMIRAAIAKAEGRE